MQDERLKEVKTIYEGAIEDCYSNDGPQFHNWLELFSENVALVDEKSTILACNSAFERLKANKSLVYVYSGRINFYDKDVRFWYHEFLQGQQSFTDDVYYLKTQGQCTVLKLKVVDTPVLSTAKNGLDKFLLLIENTDEKVRVEQYKRFFNLTSAEANLAANMSMGKTLNQLAEEKLLSKHTLRTQLKSVFLKTDTHSQNELVVLLKNVV